jgi:ribulose-5-phosphate 4-epimerase/fuculose-1-phosphate aldolase
VFEIRDVAGDGSDLLIRNRELGAALARCLGQDFVVLMRGHGSTVVAESVRVAIYRAVYTVVNARLLLQSHALGEVVALTPAEAQAARIATEGQVERPWNLWRERAQR